MGKGGPIPGTPRRGLRVDSVFSPRAPCRPGDFESPLIMPRVTIIVLHWGDPRVTAACLESLRQVHRDGMEVLVIDNGTPDRSGEGLRREFPEFVHHRIEANQGFAGGNNVGLRRALEAEAEFALLLNNDTEVAPDFLDRLLEAAAANPRAALLTPKILCADPPGVIWFARGRHSLWTGLAQHADRHRRDDPSDTAVEEITFATGCALLIRLAALREIGLLDESLFMYSEDLDLSIRARKAGWTILSARAARVVHHEPVQRRKGVPDAYRLYLSTRNLVRVEIRHARPWHHLTFWPWFLLRWMGYLTAKNLALGFPGDAWALWAGLWAGLRDEAGRPTRQWTLKRAPL
jgi:GT2 family glycosyltransferase